MKAERNMHTNIFPDGSSLVRPSELAWSPWLVPGVEFKVLDIDRDFNKTTFLLRSTAGARLEGSLRHQGAAEYFVEMGDVSVDGERLEAHDYLFAPGGTLLQDLRLSPDTQVYAIVHGGLKVRSGAAQAETLVDVDWWLDAAQATSHLA